MNTSSDNSLKDMIENQTTEQLSVMQKAGADIKDCYRLLLKNEEYGNIVREVLRDQGDFVEYDHYPDSDVYDVDSFSQYFYHAHRGIDGENGHFHTFLYSRGMPEKIEPAPYKGDESLRPQGDEALSHIISISMNPDGYPIGLFSTNRWVTGETFYKADDVIAMMDNFKMDLLYPSWPVNIWITSMIKLFRPQIEVLLRQRDQTIGQWQLTNINKDVYEDRDLEVTSQTSIDVDNQIKLVNAELQKRAA